MSSEAHEAVPDQGPPSPHEDLERAPDGVPHNVVGLTAGFSVVLAVLVATLLFLGGHGVGIAATIVICAFAIPVLVGALRKKAETQRDHVHPSR